MELAKLTWSDVETYLKHRSIIIIPIGSAEQHGPNGLLGTDALIANHLALALGERTSTLTAPCLNYGMSTYHLGFPGTITLKPTTLLLVITDLVESLLGHGFKKFFFVNGHGGNIANLQMAIHQIALTTNAEFTVQSWWHDKKINDLTIKLFHGREGSHATPGEISMTKYLFPGQVKDTPSTWTEPQRPIKWSSNPEEFRKLFPTGAIGSDPSLANEADGKLIFETVVQGLITKLHQFEETGIITDSD